MHTCAFTSTFVLMNILSLHIEYLLTQHDCVVVPGLGALVVQHSHATFEAGSAIAPPRRWLCFNPLLAHNDALLAHSVMKAEQCSYDEAMTIIGEQVSQWLSTLQQGGSVVLDNIGSFSRQENGAIIFNESASVIVNKSLTILPELDMPLLADILPFEAEDERVETATQQPVKITWYRRTARAIASVAAIVILMLFISTPVDNFQPTNDYAGLVASELLCKQEVAPIADTTIDIADEAVAETITDEMAHSDNYTTPEPLPVVETSTHETPRYILVIGSLPTRNLAEKQIAEFASMGVNEHINIFESNGRYRLYIEGYDTMQQAQLRLNDITAQAILPVTGIWICSTR